MPPGGPNRCAWARGAGDAIGRYHDEEWGVPSHEEAALFELLSLEGAQAGLSWETVLKRRAAYRSAFSGFDAAAVACYDDARIDSLMADRGLIRHRRKLTSVVENARVIVSLRTAGLGLDQLLWSAVGYQTLQPARRHLAEVPAKTPESERLSRELRRRGLSFVGPVICYSLMQAAGLVNDHTTDCFRFEELGGRGSGLLHGGSAEQPPARVEGLDGG